MFGKDRSPASYPRDIYEHTTNVCFMRLFGLIGSFSLYVAREPFSQILCKNEMDIIRGKKEHGCKRKSNKRCNKVEAYQSFLILKGNITYIKDPSFQIIRYLY
jgi:hypothetical protein